MAATSTVDKTAEAALQTWEDIQLEQRQWLPLWQEVADFTQPRKGNIAFKRSPAQQQTDRMFDSTAPHANELLAASMQGSLTSSAFRWFSLRIKNVEVAKDSQLAQDLDWCGSDMFDAYNASNFASETHEIYLDAPCFGTTAISVEERPAGRNVGPGALRFTAFAPGSFGIDEDAEGYVDTFYRKYQMSARAAATQLGRGRLGKQVLAALAKNSNEKFDFLHCVYPRTDIPLNLGRAMPATKYPYASIVVDMQGRVTCDESGYHEQAVMVPRWTKTSGERYGRGPGIIALPAVKTLNKAVELKLKAWAKAVDPPLMVRDEGVVDGSVQFKNGGITYVRDMDAIKALTELSGSLQGADMEEEKTRAEIRRMFYSDQLQMADGGPQMTAYETQVRFELMQRVLGPTLGRLNVEWLNPCTNRVFWIRLRASGKNSPYRRIQDWCKKNNVAMDVEYEGPLAKAQRLAESTAMQRFLQIILPLSEGHPEIMDNVDLDYMVREHAESVGTPAKMLRSEADVKKIRDARAAQAAQAAKAQQTGEMAKSVGALSPALKVAADAKGGGDAGGVAPLVAALSGQKDGALPQASPVLQRG